MKRTLKDLAMSELTPLIPFAFTSKKFTSQWTPEGSTVLSKTGLRKVIPNALISGALLIGGSAYSTGSAIYQDFDYKNWAEIDNQREQQFQKNRFYNLDKNNDGVIDLTEFMQNQHYR